MKSCSLVPIKPTSPAYLTTLLTTVTVSKDCFMSLPIPRVQPSQTSPLLDRESSAHLIIHDVYLSKETSRSKEGNASDRLFLEVPQLSRRGDTSNALS